ncbi:STAS domain-containing protein [Amycolatopsis sp., V23-08]|uniref:STAS domain-containing protein n=1 Tax=Amycolatopsis heterodermiae TaxID=3110235 RepID=A0ABU5R5U2_9PSEU|nr:STAS domain-containing protein [Amycolatopsis sp., V23-08]MEA5361029.1 STAS domain-containing protein [Amycolatopsis sp., V23-08]
MSAATPLTCTVMHPAATVTSIGLHGDLEFRTTRLLRAATAEALTRPRLRTLVLDCARLDFLDSSGLSALLAVRAETDAADVELRLENRPQCLEQLLHRTMLITHFGDDPASGAAGPELCER